MQVEKFAASMGHAADVSDALLSNEFVAREVVSDQLAVPEAQEVAGVRSKPINVLIGTMHSYKSRKRFERPLNDAAVAEQALRQGPSATISMAFQRPTRGPCCA